MLSYSFLDMKTSGMTNGKDEWVKGKKGKDEKGTWAMLPMRKLEIEKGTRRR
jgi:hypothetical protein